jgi:hypothetical protein
MKTAEFKRVVRPLLPQESEWGFRKAMVYRKPVGRTLLGVLATGSSFDNGAFITVVKMPLCVPEDTVVLDYSRRVGGGASKYYVSDRLALEAAIKEGLLEVEELTARADATLVDIEPSMNPRTEEMRAYNLYRAGQRKNAVEILREAARYPPKYDWEREIVDRVAKMAELIGRGDDAAVDAEFRHARKHTLAALGIGDH